jgi:hypothetical protein
MAAGQGDDHAGQEIEADQQAYLRKSDVELALHSLSSLRTETRTLPLRPFIASREPVR